MSSPNQACQAGFPLMEPAHFQSHKGIQMRDKYLRLKIKPSAASSSS